ncbi:MAG: hypothetical protein WAM85_23690, partial [Terracidiphilus sp.]
MVFFDSRPPLCPPLVDSKFGIAFYEGSVNVRIQLETDSVEARPKGQLHIVLPTGTLDPQTGKIKKGTYIIDTPEVGIGGKHPGASSIADIGSSADIPVEDAQNVVNITIDANCTGNTRALFGA